jgi:D-tagatose-1,6-bisphosphate aldolase subunit GatZ/KbaZ
MRGVPVSAKDTSDFLIRTVRMNRERIPVGIYSICSSNPLVLNAGMSQALADDAFVCIESTPNQVNQFGGYAGMTPEQFAAFVKDLAVKAGFPVGRIVLGGDHLGPHVWREEPTRDAMSKARDLVRHCICAGYKKIHLDTSMRCADDPGDDTDPPAEEAVTERAADLCLAAEQAWARLEPGSPAPVYVIGTEVPAPGGERHAASELAVTDVRDVERTLTMTRDAFFGKGLHSAWDRVIAVVVQPGVEFGDSHVYAYDRIKAQRLSSYVEKDWSLVFEAHSTDYQLPHHLKQMVEDHFAILKVGPWLTFALREALFALAEIERNWLSGRKGIELSNLPETIEMAMLENPAHWAKYYHGDDPQLRFARKYSYSDRMRYYWPLPQIQRSLQILLGNLSLKNIPLTLLSQYLPAQYASVRAGKTPNVPSALIDDKIAEVLDVYARACGMRP